MPPDPPTAPPGPRLPAWFTGVDDPWLTRRMRDVVAITAAEQRIEQAAGQAIAGFLDAARTAILGPAPTVTAAADLPPPDLNAWPDQPLWRRLFDRYLAPAFGGVFGERYSAEAGPAAPTDTQWRQAYLQDVWSRLKLWPAGAWDDIRPELLEAVAQGEDHRRQRERIGRVLRIDAPARRIEAQINQLTRTLDDPATAASVRREARARRARLYRAKDREDSRWQPYAARIARTEVVGSMNAGTYAGAQAYQAATGTTRYKQWWCVAGDTPVRGAGVTHAARRPYHGDMIRLTVASPAGERGRAGPALRQLTITPDHPVLAERGWIPAGQINQADRLVGCRLDQRDTGGDPEVQGQPATIAEVFDAATQVVPPQRVVRGAVDLHSDRPDSYVDVVLVDRVLADKLHPTVSQPADHLVFALPDVTLPGLLGAGPPRQRLGGQRAACLCGGNPGMACRRDGGGFTGGAELASFAVGADGDPVLTQDAPHHIRRHPEPGGDSPSGLAQHVGVDDVDGVLVAAAAPGGDGLSGTRLRGGFWPGGEPAARCCGWVQQHPGRAEPSPDGAGAGRGGGGNLLGRCACLVSPDDVLDVEVNRGPARARRLAGVTNGDASSAQPPQHRGTADTVVGADLLGAVARVVTTHEVVQVERFPFRGQVYDLSTQTGWFVADGLLIHNSTVDNRVRPSHLAAHMQVQPLNEKFRVGYSLLDHPGDPTGPGYEVINCRCSLITMGEAEAARERQRYQSFLGKRTNIHGQPIDEHGQPVTASGEEPMSQPRTAYSAALAAAAAPAPPAGQTPPVAEGDRVKLSDGRAGVVTDVDTDDGQVEVRLPSGEIIKVAVDAVTVTRAASHALPWQGVLAPLGLPSADGRRIDPPAEGQLLTRDLPLPLLYQERLARGHDQAEQGLANITAASIQPGSYVKERGLVGPDTPVADGALFLVGEGTFDAADPAAADLARKVADGYLRWVSVDLDKVGKPKFHKYRDDVDLGPLELEELGLPGLLIELGAALESDPGLPAQFGATIDGDQVTAVAEPYAALEHFAQAAGHPSTVAALNGDAGFRARFGVELAEGESVVEAVDRWRLMSATLVSQPAFPQAYITMEDATPSVDLGELEAWLAAHPVPDEVLAALPAPDDAGPDDGDGAGDGEAAAVADDAALTAAVTGDTALPLGDRDRPWDSGAAVKRVAAWAKNSDGTIDPGKFGRAFLWREDGADATLLGSYKLPFADVINGTLTAVPRGVFAAAAAIQGSRGGVSIPAAAIAKVKGKLGTLYGRIAKAENDDSIKPPWEGGIDRTTQPIPRQKPHTARPRHTKTRPPLPPAAQAALTAAAESWAHRAAQVAAGLHEPPADFFTDPHLDRPTNVTITPEGRVFGHVHDWTTAHIGYSGRTVRAPRSRSNYAHFNLKPVRCSDGSYVRCGALVLGTHHAGTSREWSTNRATEHYDHSGYRVARVRAGEDEHGTWISGALVPGVTPEQILDLAELTCSGDWRDGELVAALMVNVPGFPIMEGNTTAPLALVAAGVIPREELGLAELTAPGVPPVTVDELADAVVERIYARQAADTAAAAPRAAEQAALEQRQAAEVALAQRAWAAQTELLAAQVYRPRAARLARHITQHSVRRQEWAADAAGRGA